MENQKKRVILVGAGGLVALQGVAAEPVQGEHLVDQFDGLAAFALGLTNDVRMVADELNIQASAAPRSETPISFHDRQLSILSHCRPAMKFPQPLYRHFLKNSVYTHTM